MTDRDTIRKIIDNDRYVIWNFFFVRCKRMLSFIGSYYCKDRQTPEELIGEFYIFLSLNDWHKLRIFKYTCSLDSYISIIASRYFKSKRDKEMLPLNDSVKNKYSGHASSNDSFFMDDLNRVLERMNPLDRFLVKRILIDGEKPRNILDEARTFIKQERDTVNSIADNKKLSGYIYTRYNRAKKDVQRQMMAMGYSK